MKKESTKSYDVNSVKEFFSLNNQFLAVLLRINKLLDNDNVNDALDMFDSVKHYTEQMNSFKNKLPAKDVLAQDNFLLKLREQQEKLNREVAKAYERLNIHFEIASNVTNFIKDQLTKQKLADMGYNHAGTIAPKDQSLRPVAFVGEI